MKDEDDSESTEADEMEMANAEIEKLMKGLEHGSSRDTAVRGRAGRRGDTDEVSGIGNRSGAFHRERALSLFYIRARDTFDDL